MGSGIEIVRRESASLALIDLRAIFLDQNIVLASFTHGQNGTVDATKKAFEAAAENISITTHPLTAKIILRQTKGQQNHIAGYSQRETTKLCDAVERALKNCMPKVA